MPGGYAGNNNNINPATGQPLTKQDIISTTPSLQASEALMPQFDSMAQDFTDSQGQYANGLDALRTAALRKGPSQWLGMTEYSNALNAKNAREKGMNQNASNTAGAEDALAASGGLSSGARERVQEQGQKNYISMAENVQNQEQQANLGAGIQDESNRQTAVGNLTTAEEAKQKDWLTSKQQDYQNQLDIYKTQMDAWAAERQADATENAGKK